MAEFDLVEPHGTLETPISPFVDLERETWARLSDQMEQPLNLSDIERPRGLGDELDLQEVRDVYLPLSRLLYLYVEGAGATHQATTTFLGEQTSRTPFVIGVAGSVAVGKSTTARVFAEIFAPLAANTRRPAHYHRRFPVPQRRAGAAWHHAPQGLPGIL